MIEHNISPFFCHFQDSCMTVAAGNFILKIAELTDENFPLSFIQHLCPQTSFLHKHCEGFKQKNVPRVAETLHHEPASKRYISLQHHLHVEGNCKVASGPWGARVSFESESQERALIRGQLDRPRALTVECDKHAKTQQRVRPSSFPANVSGSDKHKSIRGLSLSDNQDQRVRGGHGTYEGQTGDRREWYDRETRERWGTYKGQIRKQGTGESDTRRGTYEGQTRVIRDRGEGQTNEGQTRNRQSTDKRQMRNRWETDKRERRDRWGTNVRQTRAITWAPQSFHNTFIPEILFNVICLIWSDLYTLFLMSAKTL